MSNSTYRNISAWTNDHTPYVRGKVEDDGTIKAELGLTITTEGEVPQWVVDAWTNYFQRALHRACIDYVHSMADMELGKRFPLIMDGKKIATPIEESDVL